MLNRQYSIVKAACKQSATPLLGFTSHSPGVAYELRPVGSIRSLSGFVRFAHSHPYANPLLGFAPRSLGVAYELRSVGSIRSLSGFVRFAHSHPYANPLLGFAPRSLGVAYELRSVGSIRSLSGFVRFAHFIRTQIRYTCISFSNPNNELTDSSS